MTGPVPDDAEAIQARRVRDRTAAVIANLMVEHSGIIQTLQDSSHNLTSSPSSTPLSILENVCVLAPISQKIITHAKQSDCRVHITAGDIMFAERLGLTTRQVGEHLSSLRDGHANITLDVVPMSDMVRLPLPSSTFTHCFTNFAMAFCNDDDKAVTEIFRVLRPGGLAIFSTWKSLGWKVDSADQHSDVEPLALFPSAGWRHSDYIVSKLEKHGFYNISVNSVEIPTDGDEGDFEAVSASLVRMAIHRLLDQPDTPPDMAQEMEESMFEEVMTKYKAVGFDGVVTPWITLATKPLSPKSNAMHRRSTSSSTGSR